MVRALNHLAADALGEWGTMVIRPDENFTKYFNLIAEKAKCRYTPVWANWSSRAFFELFPVSEELV